MLDFKTRKMSKQIEVQGIVIRMDTVRADDYISLTDIARHNNENKPADTISNWLRNSATLRYLETWEKLHNPSFKLDQMIDFKMMAQNYRTAITAKRYIETTNAVGLISKAGKYGGGTWAHGDIALEFCTWLSPEFKVYFYKEFQRLKRDEFEMKSLRWHVSKITDNVEEIRNLLDTIPGQEPVRSRIAPTTEL